MIINWTPNAWDQYLYWQAIDKKKIKRINELIKHTKRDPFKGIGSPEALKHDLLGYWFRRIDGEHRFVYKCTDTQITIVACRYHY
ncbi:MAG: Txe/YoeB family addiction module toxin [Bacteroidia bacterium]